MATLGDRIKEAAKQLGDVGYSSYGQELNDAYLYASTSSEIYFKTSGVLNAAIVNCQLNDDLLSSLKRLKSDIDQHTK